MNYYADAQTSALSFMKYTELKDLTVQELTALLYGDPAESWGQAKVKGGKGGASLPQGQTPGWASAGPPASLVELKGGRGVARRGLLGEALQPLLRLGVARCVDQIEMPWLRSPCGALETDQRIQLHNPYWNSGRYLLEQCASVLGCEVERFVREARAACQ